MVDGEGVEGIPSILQGQAPDYELQHRVAPKELKFEGINASLEALNLILITGRITMVKIKTLNRFRFPNSFDTGK